MSFEPGEPCLLGDFRLPQASVGPSSGLAVAAGGGDFCSGPLERVGDRPEPTSSFVYVVLSSPLLLVATLAPAHHRFLPVGPYWASRAWEGCTLAVSRSSSSRESCSSALASA